MQALVDFQVNWLGSFLTPYFKPHKFSSFIVQHIFNEETHVWTPVFRTAILLRQFPALCTTAQKQAPVSCHHCFLDHSQSSFSSPSVTLPLFKSSTVHLNCCISCPVVFLPSVWGHHFQRALLSTARVTFVKCKTSHITPLTENHH